MSYTSENVLQKGTSLKQVSEIIDLLGYKKENDGFSIPNRRGSYLWIENEDYKSWVGIELDVMKIDGIISVSTRTRLGRSYWDLAHQNKTIKMLKDLFGGSFTTDEGKNKYFIPEYNKPPSPIMSGCYLARWRFNNALIKPKIYLQQRNLTGDISREKPTGLLVMDDMNPRFFSNNLIIPYLVAIWEEYFKSSFIVLLKYSSYRESAFKRAKLSQNQLELIATGSKGVEETFTETFSFQRPSIISSNYKLIDPKLDIAGVLRKPYRKRKKNLYESIENIIELRNEFVHTGNMDPTLTDKIIEKLFKDFEVAVDRVYDKLGEHFNFIPSRFF